MINWPYRGFNPAAQKILDEKIKVGEKHSIIVYFDDRQPNVVNEKEDIFECPYTLEEYEVWYPCTGCELSLNIYRFKDGRVWESYIQAEPWNPDPCTFLALRDHVTEDPIVETLWDQIEIDNA